MIHFLIFWRLFLCVLLMSSSSTFHLIRGLLLLLRLLLIWLLDDVVLLWNSVGWLSHLVCPLIWKPRRLMLHHLLLLWYRMSLNIATERITSLWSNIHLLSLQHRCILTCHLRCGEAFFHHLCQKNILSFLFWDNFKSLTPGYTLLVKCCLACIFF